MRTPSKQATFVKLNKRLFDRAWTEVLQLSLWEILVLIFITNISIRCRGMIRILVCLPFVAAWTAAASPCSYKDQGVQRVWMQISISQSIAPASTRGLKGLSYLGRYLSARLGLPTLLGCSGSSVPAICCMAGSEISPWSAICWPWVTNIQ